MLIPGIQGYGEKTSRLPFEALFAAVGLPNRGGAATVENIDQRLEDVPLRIETLSRWNGANVSVIKITRPVQHDIDAVTADPVPPLERDGIEIIDEKSTHDVDSLR